MVTALWDSLIESGYSVVRVLQVDGIPYLIREREVWTVSGDVAAVPSGYTATTGLIAPSRDSGECDRERGLATGPALEFTIGREALADDGLGPALFARPTLRATLTASVTAPATTTFEVDDTSSFASSGAFYIGREYVTYSGKTGTSFTGCARGVCGYPHYHTASTASAYQDCTDRPVYWRGRLVTVWEHLVSPEGRYLGSTLCDLGDEYARHAWRGYVRDVPRPGDGGMVIACLPLERLAAQEFGAEVAGEVATEYVVAEPGDAIFVMYDDVISGPDHDITTNNGIIKLVDWCKIAENNMNSGVTEPYSFRVNPTDDSRHLDVQWNYEADGLAIRASASFLVDGNYYGYPYAGAVTTWRIPMRSAAPVDADNPRTGWIVLRMQPQADFSDAGLPAQGLIAFESGGGIAEVVTYDETRLSGDGGKRAFRISARDVLGDGKTDFNPWSAAVTAKVIAGAEGTWEACLRTLMTSSGTGDRGDYDTLPHGLGLGLPDDWIADPVGAIEAVPTAYIVAATTGKTSVEKLLCGWLALMRGCLVQRLQADGSMRLEVVSTDVVDDPIGLVTLDASDLRLDGVSALELIEAPNHIRITTSDLYAERAEIVVRDSARAQAEGVRSAEVSAPSMGRLEALRYGAEMILMSDGQAAVALPLAPSRSGVRVGDLVDISDLSHPQVWDWVSGTFGWTASKLGRVVAKERDWITGAPTATVLLAGQAQERIALCPTALVTSVESTTEFRVEPGGAHGFAVGYEIGMYELGDEVSTYVERTVATVTEGTSYDTITVTSGATFSGGAEIEITYAAYVNCVTIQRRLMFVDADKSWR